MCALDITSTDVLGIPVSQVDLRQTVERIGAWIHARDRRYVCVTGVHGIMESQRHEDVRTAHSGAGLVVPDGMPLVWVSRARGFKETSRVYGPDLLLACCDRGREDGWRHFFYGGADGVADLLADRLQGRFPGLAIAGTLCPPFRPLSSDEVRGFASIINGARPDIVWVGLSTPRQELWMDRARPHLDAPVLVGVGAAFDFHAGLKRQAPVWMRGAGLEWLFRLGAEPWRLGPRYLVNNPLFVWKLLTSRWGAAR